MNEKPVYIYKFQWKMVTFSSFVKEETLKNFAFSPTEKKTKTQNQQPTKT